MRVVWVVLLAGCFNPTPSDGAPCGTGDVCPTGQFCVAGTCRKDPAADAPIDLGVDPDGRTDAMPDGAAAHTIPPGALLWLKMDDDPTNGATDSAPANHDVTCVSCPALVAGQFGSGYVFTADRLLATAADLQPGTAFTVAAWVRPDATPTTNSVVGCKNTGTLDCSYALLVAPGRQPIYYSSGSSLTQGANAMALGTWHHIAMTWDGTTKRGYYDGVIDANAAVAAIASDATMALSIGERNGSSPIGFAGAVDDFVFYNRVLSAAEITALATP